MSKRAIVILGTLVVWSVVLFLAGKTAVDRLPVPSWGSPAGGEQSTLVVGSTRVGQLFTAPWPGLCRIEISMAAGPLSSARRISVHVTDAPDAVTDLEVATSDMSQLAPGAPLTIEFEPIRDSRGQDYYFYILPDPPGDAGDITVGYGPQTILDGANAYVDGLPIQGNIMFQTYYCMRTRDKLDLLLTRLADGRPYLLGTKGFYIALAVVYCALLTAFLLAVASRVLVEGERDA